MLLTSRRPTLVVFVPITFSALGAGMIAGSVAQLREAPSWGAAFGALVSVAISAFILGMVRVAFRADTKLVVAGLFGRQTLSAADVAFGTELKSTGRSIEYEVYASDGSERAVIFGAWSRWGAERARARLTRVLGPEEHEGARGRAAVARSDAHQAAQAAQTKAYLASLGQSSGKQAMIALAIFVVIYALGMAVYLATQ